MLAIISEASDLSGSMSSFADARHQCRANVRFLVDDGPIPVDALIWSSELRSGEENMQSKSAAEGEKRLDWDLGEVNLFVY